MNGTSTAEKEQRARDLIASAMIHGFTTAVLSQTRIMLGRYVRRIKTNDSNFLAVRNALVLYLDELRHSDEEVSVTAVANYARMLGCDRDYIEQASVYESVFFAFEIRDALRLLTGLPVEVPDIGEWNERRAIVEFDGS